MISHQFHNYLLDSDLFHVSYELCNFRVTKSNKWQVYPIFVALISLSNIDEPTFALQ
jgi:hypothetical protein